MSKEEKNNIRISKNKSILERWILPVLSVLAVSVFPVLFMYFQNSDEAKFREIVIPLVIFITIGVVLFGLFLLISRNTSKSAVIASLFILVLLNYSLLESGVQVVFPALSYWHIFPVFLFILAHAAWFVCKKIQKELANTITFVICIVFCGLVLFNGITAAPTIINKVSLENQTKKEYAQSGQAIKGDAGLPNIYFLIFDEYSSVDFIKKYYNYDNSAFTDHLEKIGFDISYTSHNESITSSTIITNIVNLNYVVNDKNAENEKANLRVNSVLYQLLLGLGYKIQEVGDGCIFELDPIQDILQNDSKTSNGDSISDILYRNTVIYPFYFTSAQGYAAVVLNCINFLANSDNFPDRGMFTAFHLNFPHCPFLFDESGNRINSLHYNDWSNQKYYLGQYKYATKLMQEVVETLIENDPDAIIILQSDHSARAMKDKINYNDMTNILNAVYYQGNKIDIEGLSGINTMIKILNTESKLNISYKEVA